MSQSVAPNLGKTILTIISITLTESNLAKIAKHRDAKCLTALYGCESKTHSRISDFCITSDNRDLCKLSAVTSKT